MIKSNERTIERNARIYWNEKNKTFFFLMKMCLEFLFLWFHIKITVFKWQKKLFFSIIFNWTIFLHEMNFSYLLNVRFFLIISILWLKVKNKTCWNGLILNLTCRVFFNRNNFPHWGWRPTATGFSPATALTSFLSNIMSLSSL